MRREREIKGGSALELKNRTGFIYVRTQGGTTRRIFDQLRGQDWVVGVWTVTGDPDLIVWVNAKHYDDMYGWSQTIKTWNGVEFTNSHFVHNGYVNNFDAMSDPNGVWVRLRTDRMDTVPTQLKDYNDRIGCWVNMPGEYDFMIWFTGTDTRDALDNVLRFTENRNWRSHTHVPCQAYLNPNYRKGF